MADSGVVVGEGYFLVAIRCTDKASANPIKIETVIIYIRVAKGVIGYIITVKADKLIAPTFTRVAVGVGIYKICGLYVLWSKCVYALFLYIACSIVLILIGAVKQRIILSDKLTEIIIFIRNLVFAAIRYAGYITVIIIGIGVDGFLCTNSALIAINHCRQRRIIACFVGYFYLVIEA